MVTERKRRTGEGKLVHVEDGWEMHSVTTNPYELPFQRERESDTVPNKK